MFVFLEAKNDKYSNIFKKNQHSFSCTNLEHAQNSYASQNISLLPGFLLDTRGLSVMELHVNSKPISQSYK